MDEIFQRSEEKVKREKVYEDFYWMVSNKKKENQFSVVLVFDFETFDGIKAVPYAFVFYLGVELKFKKNPALTRKDF